VETVHLHNSQCSVQLRTGPGSPALLHWGAPLPSGASIRADDMDRGLPHGVLPVDGAVAIVPEHGVGTPLRPGLLGHRPDGSGWAPIFTVRAFEHTANGVRVRASDTSAGLELTTEVTLGSVLAIRTSISNVSDEPYVLQSVMCTVALPPHADEIITYHGRWANELQPHRAPWFPGTISVENRRGRTSHDHFPMLVVGTHGFGEHHGEAWCLHLAWSGNHQMLAHVLADGTRAIQFGELLHPGEVVLEPGESYESPTLLGSYSSAGLNRASHAFHDYVRSLPSAPRTTRPVTLNTWEAVYFDHRPDRLMMLATAAAEVGVERFVLDDGWFSTRRNDRSGLGDWTVSNDVYPNGLTPLIEHVQTLGMTFGLWVEPEMANPDSDLFRAHPDWILATPGYTPVLGRNQLVLDLTNPAAFEHVLDAVDSLLQTNAISYLKWDMNRDHVHASSSTGRAATHQQTLAVYRMIDELRRRHPHVEIESCASGGGRMDLGMLSRTQRVWLSDSNDALDRQVIQRSASVLLPPEVMGMHIGPERAHTTGRRHDLAFRAAAALFGHLGIEMDLLALDDQERERLAQVVSLHKQFRPLFHGGRSVRLEHPDASLLVHGVYAVDASEALLCVARLTSGGSLHAAPLRVPGLTPEVRYSARIVPLHDSDRVVGPALRQPPWTEQGITLHSALLAERGIELPILWPEHAVLIHLTR